MNKKQKEQIENKQNIRLIHQHINNCINFNCFSYIKRKTGWIKNMIKLYVVYKKLISKNDINRLKGL